MLIVMPKNVNYQTLVSSFIRRYCGTTVNGAYVKRYLYFLQKGFDRENVTIKNAAQEMVCQEMEILRAFNYWEKAGAMKYEMDPKAGGVTKITFYEITPVRGPETQRRMISRTIALLDKNDIVLSDIGKAQVKKWFEEYGTAEELVAEAIARSIRKNGKAVFKYIDAIILAWSRKGLKTMKDVREDERAYFVALKTEGRADE